VAEKYLCYFHNAQRALFEEDYGKHAKSSTDAMSEFDESMRSLETSSGGQLTSDHETVPRFPRYRQIQLLTYTFSYIRVEEL
jgi:hypothetical protein